MPIDGNKNTLAEIVAGATAGAAAALSGVASAATTYYVTTGGNDGDTGLSWSAPLLTIDAAINKCSPNDIIRVGAGAFDENAAITGVTADVNGVSIIGSNTTEDQQVTTVVNSNGSATAVFTVSANNNYITGLTILETTTTVEGIVSTGDYNVFESVKLSGAMENGIHLDGAIQNTIKDCLIFGMTNDAIELSGATVNCIIDGGIAGIATDNNIHLNGDGADANLITNIRILGGGISTNGIHLNGADNNFISKTVEIGNCTVGILLAAGSLNNSLGANVTCTTDITDNSGSATNNKHGSLTHLHEDMYHVDKFTGHSWYIDGTSGANTNNGRNPDAAFATIATAIAAAGVGDKIVVMAQAGKYDENGLDMNLQGLELHFEEGAILEDTTPGTVLTVSAQDCRLVGVVIDNDDNGGIGFNVTTAASMRMEKCQAIQCTTGFMLDGVKGVFTDCQAVDNSTTGFDIQTKHATFINCIANGDGQAVRGFYLSDNSADLNTFVNCHTLGNTTAGWEIIVGADENLFTRCSMGTTDGAKVDAGANNSWVGFEEESQISGGQTREQDLKDIFDDTITISGGTLPASPTSNSLAAFIASGGTSLGQELPTNMSLIDIIGDYTGAYNGSAQDDNIKAALDIIDTEVGGIQTDLSNGTDGLGALKILIDANQVDLNTIIADVTGINGDVMRGTDSATLAATWTDARAGYLDELGAANLPADVDAITAVVETSEAAGTLSYLDAGAEQDILEQTISTRRKIESIWLDLVNMTQNGTIKLYHKVDATNYREFDSLSFTVATDSDGVLIDGFAVNNDWKITYTESVDEGAARDLPYNVIWREME